MKYLIAFLALPVKIHPVLALGNHSMLLLDIQTYIVYGVAISVLLVFILVIFVLLRAFNVLTRIILKTPGYANTGEETNIATNSPFLRPVYLLYGGIALLAIFAMVYFLSDNTSNAGQNSPKTEIAGKVADPVLNPVSAAATSTSSSGVSLGASVFSKNCSVCHGAQGQGIVGPNLTDAYWIHGGKIADLSKSINNGYLDKGMPAWGKVLSASKISDVVDFITSLKGTTPPNPKTPQGVKE